MRPWPRQSGSADAAVVVTAATIDLVLVIPFPYYLLVVRGRGLPTITLLPVFRMSRLVRHHAP